MNSLNLKTLALALGLVLTAAAPAVLAHAPGGPRHGMEAMHGAPHGGPMMRMLDAVNATDAQREQIRAIFKAAHEELKPLREQGRALHQQAQQAFTAANVDANAVENLRRQKQALHEQVSQRLSRAMVDAAKVLTPEQRAQMATQMKERMDRMERKRERMHERMQERKHEGQPRHGS